MAIGDVHRLKWVWIDQNTGKNLTSGLHVALNTNTPFVPATPIAAMYDFWDVSAGGSAALKTHCAAAIQLVRITSQMVFPLPLGLEIQVPFTNIAGTDAGDNTAAQTSVLVSLRSGLAGRRNRGRMYLPPASELDASGGGLAAGVATDIVGRVDALLAALNTVDYDPVIFSKVGSTIQGITDAKVDNRVRTQRRRQVRAPNYVG